VPPPPSSPPGANPNPQPSPTPSTPPDARTPPSPSGSSPAGARAAGPRGTGVTRRSKDAAITGENWHFWWAYNRDRFLKLKTRLFADRSVHSESAEFFFGRHTQRAARDTDRPGPALVRDRLLPRLLDALKDPTFQVRYRAAVAVGKVGGEGELDALVKALGDRDELVREGATVGIALMAVPKARSVLIALLEDKAEGRRLLGGRSGTDELRGIAALGLGLLAHAHPGIDGDGSMRRVLMRHSLDPKHDHHIPMAAVISLGLFKEAPQTVREITKHLKGLTDRKRGAPEWVRAQAVLAIGRLVASNPGQVDPTNLEFLIDTLEGAKSAGMKRSAALALGCVAMVLDGPDSGATRALAQELAKGKDRLTRCFAAVSLGQMGGSTALQALTRGLLRHKHQLKVFCGLGLGILCGALAERREAESVDDQLRMKGVQYLRTAFERTRSPDLKGGLAIALGIAGDRPAGSMVLEAFRAARDTVLRGDCAVALGLLDHTAAAGVLLDTMKRAKADPRLREHAAVGLGLMGSRAMVRPLVEALRTERSHYALTAITLALGLVGDRTAVDPLTALLDPKKHPSYTRTYAGWALGSLGDHRSLPVLTPVRSNHNYHACCVNFNAMLVLIDL